MPIQVSTLDRQLAALGPRHMLKQSLLSLSPLDSPLQIAVLNLFIQLKSRFPNMVSGVITRESVRNAFLNGITAEQVKAKLQNWTVHPNTICEKVS